MLALKIIGGIVGAMAATVVVMFVFFFAQAANEIQNCKLLTPDEFITVHGVTTRHHPEQRAYQCADGVHWQPHQ